MTTADLQSVKKALTQAGVEIYRTRSQELQIAERVRLHIMDSGVRVLAGDLGLSVCFTARSQRSDFPNASDPELLEKVRDKIGTAAAARGYGEVAARTTNVHDPVDAAKVLDVWHEVTFQRAIESDIALLIEEVRWALSLEKYIGR